MLRTESERATIPDNAVPERWLQARKRTDKVKWALYVVLWIGIVGFGIWAGFRLGSLRAGLYTGLGSVVVCLFYAAFLLTGHLKRVVHAQDGQFPTEIARIQRLLEPLCQSCHVPLPEVFIIPTWEPNACAAGIWGKQRYVGVTVGAHKLMEDDELQAILAHEVTHLQRRDGLFNGWWIALSGLIVWASALCIGMGAAVAMSNRSSRGKNQSSGALAALIMMIGGVVFGIASVVIIQLVLHSVMRRSEYMADNGAVLLTGHARPLIRALTKLQTSGPIFERHTAMSMMFSTNPGPRGHWWDPLFSTHPSMRNRIARLERMSHALGEG